MIDFFNYFVAIGIVKFYVNNFLINIVPNIVPTLLLLAKILIRT